MRVPGIPYVQGRNSYSDVDSTKYGVAIHNTSNTATAEGEASYATRRTDGVSAHFYVDSDSVIQSLDTAARAGHAGSSEGNNHAVAVEITGVNSWSRQQWLERVAWGQLGRVLAVVCREYGIEVRRASVAEMQANPRVRAFYGHDDMRRAWGGTTHTDPGPNFPWDRLFVAVKAAMEGDDVITDEDVARIAAAVAGYQYPKDTGMAFYSHARDAAAHGKLARAELATLRTEVAAALGRDLVDEQAIATAVLAGLATRKLEDAATALRAVFGDRAAQLGALLTGTTG